MADIAACLRELYLNRKIGRDDVDAILAAVKRRQRRYAKTMSASQAERQAIREEMQRLADEAARRKQLTVLHVLATKRITGAAQGHEDGILAGALAHLVRDVHGKAPWSNVEGRADSVLATLHRMFGEGLEAYHPRVAGAVQDKPGLVRLVRELFGEETGDKTAAAAARAWTETAEYARQRFNAAGGDIARLEDWRLPQFNDPARVKAAGFDAWRAAFRPRDLELMQARHGLEAAELDAALREVFDTIATDGLNKITPGAVGGRKLANRRADHRFLMFADADGWLAYNERFGRGDIYSILTGHLDGMSRDIGLLEVLGPNPDAMVRHLHDLARQAEGTAPAPGLAAKLAPGRIFNRLVLQESPQGLLNVYDVVSGRVNSPVSDLTARIAGGTRNLLSMAQLGSAPLSAVTDLSFLTSAAHWNGLDATRVLKRHLSLLNPANAADRAFAARSGLVAQSWTSHGLAAKRFQDEIVGAGWTGRLADGFHRVTGLTPWTQAGRHAFGLEYMATVVEQSGKTFDQLDPAFRRGLEVYGVTAEMWQAVRRSTPQDFKGARFLDPVDLVRSDDPLTREAGQRIHELILEQTDFAVPEPDARARAFTTQGTRRGTVVGEFWRSTMMYKTFPVTVLTTHMARIVHQASPLRRGQYAAELLIGLTVLGAAAIQFKQIAAGKDPRDMNPITAPEFWPAAFIQGGGLGIFGDFLYTAFSRTRSTLPENLAGPVLGAMGDVARLTSGNIRRAYDDDDVQFSAELVRFAQRYTPGSNIWYLRLGLERLVFDQLRMAADPDWRQHFRRMERRAREGYGQDYYWRPGRPAPERAPDPAAAVGLE